MRRSDRRRHRMTGVAIALSLLTAACGSALTDEEIQAGSGQRVTRAASAGEAEANVATTTPAGEAPVGPSGDVAAGPEAAPSGESSPTEDRGGGGDGGGGGGGTAGGGTSASGPGGCRDSASGPLVLGNFGDYSGPAGASTVDIPNGVRIWAASVNAKGGLCGRRVQILSADAGGDPARGAAIVRDQVEKGGAIAFVSNSGLTSGNGAYPYLLSKQISVIGDPLADDSAKNSATIMAAFPTIQEAGLASMRSARQISGAETFGMMYCAESRICSEIHDSLKANAGPAGAKWVWDARVSLVQVDFTAECRSAQQAGVKVLPLMMDAASILRIARSCNRQGFRPVYVLIGNAITATTTREPGFEKAIILSLSFPFAGASTPAIDEYHRARETYLSGRPSNGGMATGWATAKLFEVVAARAVQSAGTMTTESIAAAMQTLKKETAGGLVPGATWGPQGTRSEPCVFPMRGDGSGGYLTPLGVGPIC